MKVGEEIRHDKLDELISNFIVDHCLQFHVECDEEMVKSGEGKKMSIYEILKNGCDGS